MNTGSNNSKRWILIGLIVLVGAAAFAFFATRNRQTSDGNIVESPGPVTGSSASVSDGSDSGKSLPDFCNDEELYAWFDGIEENTPVHLEYIVYGEAPYSMEFDDPALIVKTARALETVKIGGVSEENPDYVSDGGGHGYYFTMADGTERSFYFVIGCYHWNQGEWHDVISMGDLDDVNKELQTIATSDSSNG